MVCFLQVESVIDVHTVTVDYSEMLLTSRNIFGFTKASSPSSVHCVHMLVAVETIWLVTWSDIHSISRSCVQSVAGHTNQKQLLDGMSEVIRMANLNVPSKYCWWYWCEYVLDHTSVVHSVAAKGFTSRICVYLCVCVCVCVHTLSIMHVISKWDTYTCNWMCEGT